LYLENIAKTPPSVEGLEEEPIICSIYNSVILTPISIFLSVPTKLVVPCKSPKDTLSSTMPSIP